MRAYWDGVCIEKTCTVALDKIGDSKRVLKLVLILCSFFCNSRLLEAIHDKKCLDLTLKESQM
jgi:hypothetical protein